MLIKKLLLALVLGVLPSALSQLRGSIQEPKPEEVQEIQAERGLKPDRSYDSGRDRDRDHDRDRDRDRDRDNDRIGNGHPIRDFVDNNRDNGDGSIRDFIDNNRGNGDGSIRDFIDNNRGNGDGPIRDFVKKNRRDGNNGNGLKFASLAFDTTGDVDGRVTFVANNNNDQKVGVKVQLAEKGKWACFLVKDTCDNAGIDTDTIPLAAFKGRTSRSTYDLSDLTFCNWRNLFNNIVDNDFSIGCFEGSSFQLGDYQDKNFVSCGDLNYDNAILGPNNIGNNGNNRNSVWRFGGHRDNGPGNERRSLERVSADGFDGDFPFSSYWDDDAETDEGVAAPSSTSAPSSENARALRSRSTWGNRGTGRSNSQRAWNGGRNQDTRSWDGNSHDQGSSYDSPPPPPPPIWNWNRPTWNSDNQWNRDQDTSYERPTWNSNNQWNRGGGGNQ